jgi:hypothetical protein
MVFTQIGVFDGLVRAAEGVPRDAMSVVKFWDIAPSRI